MKGVRQTDAEREAARIARNERARNKRQGLTGEDREAYLEGKRESERKRASARTQQQRDAKRDTARERRRVQKLSGIKKTETPEERETRLEKAREATRKSYRRTKAKKLERGEAVDRPPGRAPSATPSAFAIYLRKWRAEQQQKDPAGWKAKREALNKRKRDRRREQKRSGEPTGSGEVPSAGTPDPAAQDPPNEDEAEIDRMIAEFGFSGTLPDPDADEFWYLDPIEDPTGRQARAVRRGRGRRRRR